MSAVSSSRRRLLGVACATLGAAAFLAPPADAKARAAQAVLEPCGDAGAQCGKLAVPLDYDRPDGKQFGFAFSVVPATDQANKRGALLVNFGGPGGDNATFFAEGGAPRVFTPAVLAKYDIVGYDPRGTGLSDDPIDCKANQETEGLYSVPFVTPLNLDVRALLTRSATYVGKCLANNRKDLLAHASTANVARDMDQLRKALGLKKISYFGFSYGTFLGATYAALFPKNYDRMVLDGALDAEGYINEPLDNLTEQTSGFERALDRFFTACAGNQTACSNFGGTDPGAAFDALVEQANTSPIAAPRAPRPKPVTGDDILNATIGELYAKFLWPELGQALAEAAAGDASLLRVIADGSYGILDDGSFDPGLDRYFTLGAVEQDHTRNIKRVLKEGNRAWGSFDHFWFNTGYVGTNYALWPVRDRDAYPGPFKLPSSASTPLVVENLYDPATPYRGSVRLVKQLGNAAFLRVRADGHTSYGNTGPCADNAIDAYLVSGTLPAPGTICQGEQPFEAPVVAAASAARAGVSRAKARTSATKQGLRVQYEGRLSRPVATK